ncbi:peptidoglycan editing factor PgeF [Kurthia sibirica]|uniref:Purine nucleoside phosphorylase n=1 Tax=Kurthia sibirica TaxID=202750 RepID=A0A2U3AME5_9BACL|nr:peptidoglycan editing factor PgeF [Kurthia sibirica]PWI25697.1 peptidoglycan editing factor PgeF [Kurthia sibirica]GEK33702.1 laccase domain protein YlmD [Kurthia sibirica]
MTTKLYIDHDFIQAGITLKNEQIPDNNNMALHCCDLPQEVLMNRQRLAKSLQIDLQQLVVANQTHSATIYKVVDTDKGRGALSVKDAIADTDALYTFEKNIMLGIFTADCVPVIFHEPSRGLIGVIHSGWQGTIQEISSAVMHHLITIEQIDPQLLHVHLGRALSQDKFEVDYDVFEKFEALGYAEPFMYYKEETDKYHIDNQLVVKRQFERAGVPSTQITVDATCTFLHDDGFSYRQNRADGRHMTFIRRK